MLRRKKSLKVLTLDGRNLDTKRIVSEKNIPLKNNTMESTMVSDGNKSCEYREKEQKLTPINTPLLTPIPKITTIMHTPKPWIETLSNSEDEFGKDVTDLNLVMNMKKKNIVSNIYIAMNDGGNEFGDNEFEDMRSNGSTADAAKEFVADDI